MQAPIFKQNRNHFILSLLVWLWRGFTSPSVHGHSHRRTRKPVPGGSLATPSPLPTTPPSSNSVHSPFLSLQFPISTSIHSCISISILISSYALSADQIFNENCKTSEVYEARTKDIVAAAVRGFNGLHYS